MWSGVFACSFLTTPGGKFNLETCDGISWPGAGEEQTGNEDVGGFAFGASYVLRVVHTTVWPSFSSSDGTNDERSQQQGLTVWGTRSWLQSPQEPFVQETIFEDPWFIGWLYTPDGCIRKMPGRHPDAHARAHTPLSRLWKSLVAAEKDAMKHHWARMSFERVGGAKVSCLSSCQSVHKEILSSARRVYLLCQTRQQSSIDVERTPMQYGLHIEYIKCSDNHGEDILNLL